MFNYAIPVVLFQKLPNVNRQLAEKLLEDASETKKHGKVICLVSFQYICHVFQESLQALSILINV